MGDEDVTKVRGKDRVGPTAHVALEGRREDRRPAARGRRRRSRGGVPGLPERPRDVLFRGGAAPKGRRRRGGGRNGFHVQQAGRKHKPTRFGRHGGGGGAVLGGVRRRGGAQSDGSGYSPMEGSSVQGSQRIAEVGECVPVIAVVGESNEAVVVFGWNSSSGCSSGCSSWNSSSRSGITTRRIVVGDGVPQGRMEPLGEPSRFFFFVFSRRPQGYPSAAAAAFAAFAPVVEQYVVLVAVHLRARGSQHERHEHATRQQ